MTRAGDPQNRRLASYYKVLIATMFVIRLSAKLQVSCARWRVDIATHEARRHARHDLRNLGKPWRRDLSPPEPRTPCPEFVPI
jgi:hypothetical protein